MARQVLLLGLYRFADPNGLDLSPAIVCQARDKNGDGRLGGVEVYFPPPFESAPRGLLEAIVGAFTQFIRVRGGAEPGPVKVSFGLHEDIRQALLTEAPRLMAEQPGTAFPLSLYHLLGPKRIEGFPGVPETDPPAPDEEAVLRKYGIIRPKPPSDAAPSPPEEGRRRRPEPGAKEEAHQIPGRILKPMPHVPLVVEEAESKQLGRIFSAIRLWDTLRDTWGLGELTGDAGPCVLFFGPSGTGKTQAARRISSEMGRSLLIVSHDELLNKFIGESEKAIDRAFTAAEEEGYLLLFDEADSFLFTRSNAEHAWEVSIVNSLLQRMERTKVPTLFTTNLDGILDPAVGRRMLFKVRFSPPSYRARRAIWHNLIPGRAPKGDIDFDLLAALELTGGEIKNALVSACIAAAEGAGQLCTALLLDHARDAVAGRLTDIFEEERRRSGRGIGFHSGEGPGPAAISR